MIYFDNAATSFPKPDFVSDAVLNAIKNAGSYGRGSHQISLNASRIVYECRENIAKLFNAQQDRVCFTQNATHALNIAISGLIKKEHHVITTLCEHNSVLRPLYKTGAQISFLGLDEKGRIKTNELFKYLKKNTKAVVCAHASNVTGNLIDIDFIGKFCAQNGLYFILDVAQTAGIFDIDMKKSNISVVCFTGHKGLMGVQGTGGLCISSDIEILPYVVGGSGIYSFLKYQPEEYPTRLEAGTLNVHGLSGLNAAVSYINQNGTKRTREKEIELAQIFYNGIKNISYIKFYGDYETSQRVAIVSFNIIDEDSGLVCDILHEKYGICVRGGIHCAPLVHKFFGTQNCGMVRFSFSHYNTQDEIETAINAVRCLCID